MTTNRVRQMLVARWLFIGLTTAVAAATSLGLTKIVPRMYEAHVSFYVPIGQDTFSLLSDVGAGARALPVPVVFREQLRGFFAILTSERVAERAAELVKERSVGQVRAGTRFRLTTAGLFLVTATDRDPVIAARIANAYADSFNELFEEISLPRATKTRKFIEEQLEKHKAELATADDELRKFKERYRAVSLPEETSLLVKQLTEFRAQADLAAVNLKEVRTRISTTANQLRSEARMHLSQEVVATNPLVQQLEAKVRDLEVDLAGLRAKFTPLHPDVVKAEHQVRQASKLLREEVRRIVASETRSVNPVHEDLRQKVGTLYADERAMTAKVTGLQGIIRRIEGEVARLPEQERRMSELSRTVRHLEEVDRMLALRREEARIQERREIQTFLVVDRARPAENPAYPNAVLSVPAASILGGVAGVSYAILLGTRKVRPRVEPTHPAR